MDCATCRLHFPGIPVSCLQAPATKRVENAADLPPQLRNNVAVLDAPNPAAPGGKTKVFLLAMSHVSQRSLDDVRALIRATRPEVVAVELCKDRLSLLVDVENPNQVRFFLFRMSAP